MTAQPPRTIACDVSAVSADAAAVDALARLQLHARRVGIELRLCGASPQLQELLVFAGLGDVLRVEPVGEAEQGEEGCGVEEEGELDDPAR
jgi:anti-anti-sigma regulatory factor